MSEDRSTVRIRPPHGTGTTHRNQNQNQATTAASATAVAVMPSGFSMPAGGGVWMTFSCTAAFRIRFGQNTGLDGAVGAATATDRLYQANAPEQVWCNGREDTHFSVIRDTADGVFSWYISD